MKICIKCGDPKEKSEFNKLKRSKDGLDTVCRKCTSDYYQANKAYNKNYYELNKEMIKIINKEYNRNRKDVIKVYKLKYYYNLLPEQYESLFIGQDFKCAICDRELYPYSSDACVDHDHDSGRVRGALCRTCNGKLGWFENQQKAISSYLRFL